MVDTENIVVMENHMVDMVDHMVDPMVVMENTVDMENRMVGMVDHMVDLTVDMVCFFVFYNGNKCLYKTYFLYFV